MIVDILLLAAVALCIVCCVLLRNCVNRMELTLQGQFASAAKEVVELRDRLSKMEVNREADYATMEEHIADRIEKKWDDGLQSILNFNPFAKEGDE